MGLKGSRLAAYARYSSENQSEASIEDQLRRVREFVVRDGRDPSQIVPFTDYAISGASAQRPGFEALLAAIRRREIDVLLVENQDRLSRREADAFALRDECRYFGVQLICVSDGFDSEASGAELTFGFKAIMDARLRKEIADKTRRGLIGRAHAGASTGGTPYGYRTVSTGDGDGPRRIEVDEERAAIVREIFDLYLAGHSLKGIAQELNGRGIPSPRAGSHHKRQGGWVAGTIRVVLHNEKYAGRWAFNEREWVKAPGTNKRRPRLRDPRDVVRQERPDLRIIDPATWDAVQARLRAVHATFTRGEDGRPKGRADAARRASGHAFSSLLLCGVCGAPMIVHGAGYYRCGDNAKRGRAVCANDRSVREADVRAVLCGAIRKRIASPAGIAHARKLLAEELGRAARGKSAELDAARHRIERTEKRIANIVAAMADGERSEALTLALRDFEAQLRTERTAAESLAQAGQIVRLPSPEDVFRRVFNLEAQLDRDTLAAREALRRLFGGEGVRMEPQPDGRYLARASLFPVALMLESPARGDRTGPFSYDSSGGRI